MVMLSCLWHTADGVAALGLVYEGGHFRQTTTSCWGSAFSEDRLLFPSIWPDGSVGQTSECNTDNQRSNELSCGSHLMSFVTVLLLDDQGSELGWTGFCATSLRERHRIRCYKEVQKCSRKCFHRVWEDSLLGHQNPCVFLCLPQQKPMVKKVLSLDDYILVLFFMCLKLSRRPWIGQAFWVLSSLTSEEISLSNEIGTHQEVVGKEKYF